MLSSHTNHSYIQYHRDSAELCHWCSTMDNRNLACRHHIVYLSAFFLNKSKPLFSYFPNKRAHRLFIFYYSFGTLFAINSTIQLGDSWLKNILFALSTAIVITLIQNAKKIELEKKHIGE